MMVDVSLMFGFIISSFMPQRKKHDNSWNLFALILKGTHPKRFFQLFETSMLNGNLKSLVLVSPMDF